MKNLQNLTLAVIVLASAVLGCNLFSPGWKASEACSFLEESGLPTVAYTQKENSAHTCFEKGLVKNNGRVTNHPGDKNYQLKPDEASITYYAWGGFNSTTANALELSMHTGESKNAVEFQKDFLRLSEQLYQKAIGNPLPANAQEYILNPATLMGDDRLESEPENSKVENVRVEISKRRHGTENAVINMRMKIEIIKKP